MANQSYDLQAVIDAGFDWSKDSVQAHLYDGATYVGTHTLLSEVGGTWLQSREIPQRYIDGDNWMGRSVAFLMVEVLPDAGEPPVPVGYQVVLSWYDGRDHHLLGFYDEAGGGLLNVTRKGSLILRPTDVGDPPTYGIWLVAPTQP